ncbi:MULTISPECIES: class I SAM-dependent rRNA methyltransferase [Staphylococcus]|uniref:class I SAM-dependent rRNA methyltransferase n=1 Tax=Staphylococcus TaxID=1279 RepID=UPI000D3C7442|nr:MULTISPECIES: class I SAM-dependent rRNA methyltransferase [Staphylococcus]MBM6506992.1 class I SAM-dependent rRNA methyltransferase [Staphylococcus pasteuri]PTU82991.1 class I SAM-dependent rRNA methyltransferase [Staphylococcus pasteuri]PTU85286.1 class I SAM-dependent rRNA methyltransferase [Staphylococcus pasteuri]PTU87217.1 class I SAM-dependent rRNA methyltransferase [Staphylococcus pasteuri]QQT21245.1 class I SAM-dependent rRNA methyltransferase [Staphylococcus pasteuri]
MKIATLNRGKETKYHNQYPLIDEDDIYAHDHLKEGDLFKLVDGREQYIATAYVGRQHKGLGWVLSYNPSEDINTAFFKRLFEKALTEREYYYHIDGTNAFRLFNAEGDGVGGLTIDNYDGNLLIQWYSKGIYKYRYYILEAIKSTFEYQSIYEKMRFKDTEYTGGFVEGERQTFPIVIEENFTFYNVDLEDGLMTGIFLDQKEVRKKLRDQFSEGRHILNVFSYTGAFSVVAAQNALSTTSVDLANRSRGLTEENFGLNAIDPKSEYIYVMDTFDFYNYAKRHGHQYDTIVIDPPSFARNKKKTFSVQKDYDKLIDGALDILSEKGTLLLCTNSSVFSLKAFKNVIKTTLDNAEVEYEIKEVMGLPKDFKTHPHYKPSKYLKAIFVNIEH